MSVDFNTAFGRSPAEAERLTGELLTAPRPVAERLKDSAELTHWVSASGSAAQRRTLVAAFRKAGAELALVHHMAALPREQAAIFMKDYLDHGGPLAPVVEWLGMVGGIQRAKRARMGRTSVAARWMPPRARSARGSARGLGDWLKGAFEDVVEWGGKAVDAVDSLVDAVVKAGKSIGEAMAEAANWTIAKVTDLVESLISAGKKVADILAAAAARGVEQLKKYVEAVLEAGRTIGEILVWAVGQVASTVNAVVAKLLQLGRSVLEILKAVVAQGRTALVAIVKGLIAAGRKLGDIIVAVANETAAVLKPVVDALLAAGQTLRNVLVEAAKLAASACRAIAGVLLDLGKSLTELMREAAAAVGDTLKLIVQALLGLGRTLTQILAAAATLAASALKSVVQVLFALGKSLADLVVAVASQALSVVKPVFTAIVAAGRKVAQILAALAGRAVSALRTALEALLAMGVSLAFLVRDIVTGVAEAFRRDFFEGLVALGKAPLQILKAAAEIKVSILLLAFGVILEMCGGYRPLTKAEKDEAKKVFGNAIDLERVQLGFARLPDDVLRYVNIELPRAFTTMYLLNFGPGAVVDMQTIIHELAHVWQGVQEGPVYMTRALEAQMGAGIHSLFKTGQYNDGAAYDVLEADLVANGGELKKFNPEQQASIIEFFWIRAFSALTVAGGFPHVLPDEPLPSLDALLPYVRQVNPGVRVPGRTATASRKGRMFHRGSRVAPRAVAAYA